MHPTKLSELVRSRRAELGLTQRELADRTVHDRYRVHRRPNPTATTLSALAKVLGISVDSLLEAQHE